MGTNYFAVKNVCACCGRKDFEHIGKSSYGWSFSFQGSETIRDFDQWVENIKGADYLEDEYEESITVEALLEIIEKKRHGGNHARRFDGSTSESNWVDQYGNSFTGTDFS